MPTGLVATAGGDLPTAASGVASVAVVEVASFLLPLAAAAPAMPTAAAPTAAPPATFPVSLSPEAFLTGDSATGA